MAQNQQGVPQDEELLATAIPISEMEEEEAAPAAVPAPPVLPMPKAPPLVAPVPNTAPIELAETDQHAPKSTIRTFDTRVHTEDRWQRQPNKTGQGAVHVKTFVCKLRQDAIDHLDQMVNEWLEAHPEYEVKFVTSTTGALTGKLTEPALFLNVWV